MFRCLPIALLVAALSLIGDASAEVPRMVATVRELVDVLKRNYCGKVGYEYMHINDVDERRFIHQATAFKSE